MSSSAPFTNIFGIGSDTIRVGSVICFELCGLKIRTYKLCSSFSFHLLIYCYPRCYWWFAQSCYIKDLKTNCWSEFIPFSLVRVNFYYMPDFWKIPICRICSVFDYLLRIIDRLVWDMFNACLGSSHVIVANYKGWN